MHKVHIFRNGTVDSHDFKDPKEAVRFYYLSKINPSEHTHIELIPSEYESFDFFPPKVLDFSGAFANEFFVGSCKVECSDGAVVNLDGVYYTNSLDFGKSVAYNLTDSAKEAITGLMLSGAKEIGRNDDVAKTYFIYGDHLISVDDLGQLQVSPKCSTWNESIDALMYDYQKYNQEEEYEGYPY